MKSIKENGQEIMSLPLGENICHHSSPLGGEDKGEGYNDIANCNHPHPDLLPSREKEAGRSMIEMLGVLAIIGVLSVGGIAGYSKAMHRYRLNKTIEQITQIAGNIRSFFAPQKSYDGLTAGSALGRRLLKKAQLVPDEVWHTGTSPVYGTYYLEHPFDSGVIISSSPKISNNACRNDPICAYQAFRIYLYDIPVEACIDIITQDWSELNVTGIHVNNEVHTQTTNAYYLAAPVDLSDAVKACQSDDGLIWIGLFFDVDITQGDWAYWIPQSRAALDVML